MPRITLGRGIDVFAFLDADSDEAKGFTTYLGYWDGFARTIGDVYGPDADQQIVAELMSRPAVKKLRSKPFTGDESELSKILLNAWAQELGLYAVDNDDPRLMLQNLWNNVQAYYASSGLARAFLYVRTGDLPPTTHARTLRAVTGLVAHTQLLPEPWNLCCDGEQPLSFRGFASAPGECHNLETAADAFDVAAKALKTTRKRELDQLVTQHKQENRLTRAPKGLRTGLDQRTDPTTIFDFMWRNRTRSNYGDPSMFYVGALSQDRSANYVESVRLVTSSTMLVFECLIAQRAPKVLLDTAVHFISRDRSKISDQVLGSRLRAIGLLEPSEEPEDEVDDDLW